jgi:hypothetical protein
MRKESQTTTRPFVPKQQYRVVFKEACKPLHRVKKPSDMIEVVRQCLVGEPVLFRRPYYEPRYQPMEPRAI